MMNRRTTPAQRVLLQRLLTAGANGVKLPPDHQSSDRRILRKLRDRFGLTFHHDGDRVSLPQTKATLDAVKAYIASATYETVLLNHLTPDRVMRASGRIALRVLLDAPKPGLVCVEDLQAKMQEKTGAMIRQWDRRLREARQWIGLNYTSFTDKDGTGYILSRHPVQRAAARWLVAGKTFRAVLQRFWPTLSPPPRNRRHAKLET